MNHHLALPARPIPCCRTRTRVVIVHHYSYYYNPYHYYPHYYVPMPYYGGRLDLSSVLLVLLLILLAFWLVRRLTRNR